ncbi:13302_t:CDS:1, partial [Ambispora leptoticha]
MKHGLFGPAFGSGPDLVMVLGEIGNFGHCRKTDSYEYGLLGGEYERVRFQLDEFE